MNRHEASDEDTATLDAAADDDGRADADAAAWERTYGGGFDLVWVSVCLGS